MAQAAKCRRKEHMFDIDIKTLFYTNIVVNILSVCIMRGVWMQTRDRFSGVRCWFFGLLFQLAAFILIAFRGRIPDLFSVVLVNALLFGGQLLILTGLKRFYGTGGVGAHNLVALVLYTAAAWWFTVIDPFLPARNINFALGSLFLGLQSIAYIAGRTAGRTTGKTAGNPAESPAGATAKLGLPLIAVYTLMAVNDVWRIAVNVPLSRDLPYFDSGAQNSVSLFVNQVVLVSEVFVLFFMVSGRMHAELVAELAERRLAEDAALRSAEKFRKVFESSPNTLILTRIEDGMILDVNPSFEKLSGYAREASIGKTTGQLHLWKSDSDRSEVFEALRSGQQVFEKEFRFRTKDGTFLVGLFTTNLMDISGTPCLLLTIQDVTSRKADEERIRHLATHDFLTDLASGTLAAEKLDLALAIAARNAARIAVLFMDLDGFKQVNDTWGHEAGDTLLVEIARRLRSCVREADVPARVGGDEFVIILHEVGTAADACAVAEKILSAVREPFFFGDAQAAISASVGIACYPDHGSDRGALIRAADGAMYRAKQAGKNRWCMAGGNE